MIDNIKYSIKQWIHLNILLVLMMFVIRIIFFIEVTTRINVDASQFFNIILGIKYDLLLAAHLIAWIAPIFLILHYFFPKTTNKIYKTLIFIYATISIFLTEYFCNLMMPLDHVIFAYSVEDLKGAVESSTSFSIVPILYFVISLAVCILISRLWNKVKIGNILSYCILITSFVVAIAFNHSDIIRKERYCNNHTDFILATNQPSYSFIKISDHLKNNDTKNESEIDIIYEICENYQKSNDQFSYPYKNYPFYRKADYQDVLGSLLNETTNGGKPNFVFVIIESFGQCLTGAETPTISFTPFIDSLKNESLYWKNCLSATERTFGVLPTIFASTPHGKKGFGHRHEQMPQHNSLLKDFKKNDYDVSYYYGCYRDNDRYDNFLKANDIENIFIPKQGSVDKEASKLMQENNRWGIDDKELFNIIINDKKSNDSGKPFVDIVMTLSTHEPFIILEGQEKYEEQAKQILEKTNNVSAKEKNNITKNLNVFACYRYMDECVKNLIDSYKEIGKYDNTIFIITGDHRIGMMTTGNVLRSFNVPLLIHSPLLKENRQMDAVVSHYDITPTINAYLSNNFDYQVDQYCHWLGTSLDTVKEFRSNIKQAFMLNNRDVIDYLHDEYFLCRNRLYKIDSNLRLTYIEDPELYQELKKELDDYNMISDFAIKSNSLNKEEFKYKKNKTSRK